MKHLNPCILVILLLLSCSPSPETQFEKDGISITIPAGWAITDQEEIENNGYYLSIEKNGFNSSGLITMNWVDGLYDLEAWIIGYKQDLLDNPIYSKLDVSFGDVTDDKFSGIKCKATQFTTSILGLEHTGIFFAFHDDERTFCVFKQQANEDREANNAGFNKIEGSFLIQADSL